MKKMTKGELKEEVGAVLSHFRHTIKRQDYGDFMFLIHTISELWPNYQIVAVNKKRDEVVFGGAYIDEEFEKAVNDEFEERAARGCTDCCGFGKEELKELCYDKDYAKKQRAKRAQSLSSP